LLNPCCNSIFREARETVLAAERVIQAQEEVISSLRKENTVLRGSVVYQQRMRRMLANTVDSLAERASPWAEW
jgi:hypothetical protein